MALGHCQDTVPRAQPKLEDSEPTCYLQPRNSIARLERRRLRTVLLSSKFRHAR